MKANQTPGHAPRSGPRRSNPACLVALVVVSALAAACGGGSSAPRAAAAPAPAPAVAMPPPYPVSRNGGTPATGPGDRWNSCERIWCMIHRENFFVDHYVTGHTGWILHDDLRGDVFVPRHRTEGPAMPHARRTAILLCGQHVHPYLLGPYGGPVRHTGYNATLGYSRRHFDSYGTRLDPCCINGLGFGYIHSAAGRMFRFHDLDEYRADPGKGWQKPFQARAASAQ